MIRHYRDKAVGVFVRFFVKSFGESLQNYQGVGYKFEV
jgi:hypothetical protein